MEIRVKICHGKTITVHPRPSDTVQDLKRMIQAVEGYPVDQQRLIFGDKLLEDRMTLSSYGIENGSELYFLIRLTGGGRPEDDDEEGGMGDRNGRNSSKERLANFCNLM